MHHVRAQRAQGAPQGPLQAQVEAPPGEGPPERARRLLREGRPQALHGQPGAVAAQERVAGEQAGELVVGQQGHPALEPQVAGQGQGLVLGAGHVPGEHDQDDVLHVRL